MKELINTQTFLLAGLIEVLILNYIISKQSLAVLYGVNSARIANAIAALIIITCLIKETVLLGWWYFGVVIGLFIIVGLLNIVLYPILILIGWELWRAFAPSHLILDPHFEVERGQVTGCRWLSLIYSIIGGGFLLYYLFF